MVKPSWVSDHVKHWPVFSASEASKSPESSDIEPGEAVLSREVNKCDDQTALCTGWPKSLFANKEKQLSEEACQRNTKYKIIF